MIMILIFIREGFFIFYLKHLFVAFLQHADAQESLDEI